MSISYSFYADFSVSLEVILEYHINVLGYKLVMGEPGCLTNENCSVDICKLDDQFKGYRECAGIDAKFYFYYVIDKFCNKLDSSVIGDHLVFMMNDFEGDVAYYMEDLIVFIRKKSMVYIYKKDKNWQHIMEEYNILYKVLDIEINKIKWDEYKDGK